MSSIVAINHLPKYTKSSVILATFNKHAIKEIYTNKDGGTVAWVAFETPEAAWKFTEEYDGYQFGPCGQKMLTNMSTEAEIPDHATNLLSKFLHERENQIMSHTVKITGLPQNKTLRNLNELLEPFIGDHFSWEQINAGLSDYHEPINILEYKSPDSGIGLVRVAEPHMAKDVVWRTAGIYWKNETLGAMCVPDEEMDELLVNKSEGEAKDVKLFLTGIPPNTSSTEVLNILKDYPIRDIHKPSGGKQFCFVFVAQADANKILSHFDGGFRYRGRNIRISLSDKNKNKANVLPASKPRVLAAPKKTMTDHKVNNLPYGVAESNIRTVFEGFTVYKVVVKEGHAFVGITTDELDLALNELPGKQVGDRKINVRVSERKR